MELGIAFRANALRETTRSTEHVEMLVLGHRRVPTIVVALREPGQESGRVSAEVVPLLEVGTHFIRRREIVVRGPDLHVEGLPSLAAHEVPPDEVRIEVRGLEELVDELDHPIRRKIRNRHLSNRLSHHLQHSLLPFSLSTTRLT